MVLIDEPYSQEKLQDAIVAAWAAATAIPTDAFLIQLPFAEVTFDTQIQGHADATWFDAVIANAPTTRIAAAADAYAYTSTDANDYGIYGRLDVPLGALDRWQNFRAHGSGALYRRWSKLATLAAGIHPTISVRVGDRGGADSLQNCPTDWPPPSGAEYPYTGQWGGWSVARQNGTEDPAPVNVLRFGVEGGFSYRDNGPGALLPLPGVASSGMAVLTM
jgi:hypothetical protein